MKRKIALVGLLLMVFLLAPVRVVGSTPAARRLGQWYAIQIRVECLATAVEVMRGLPGFDLHMHIGQHDAHFSRRVDDVFFRHMQAVLRDMGEVLHENEQVRHLGIELMQLDTRINVLTQEMERLALLMAASTTIEVLNAVDIQLTRVSRDRDTNLGRRNTILNEAQTVMMEITLTERWVPTERETPTFGQRIRNSFVASWNGMTRLGGNMIVLLARMGLPLLIWVTFAGSVTWVAVRVSKKRSAALVKGVQMDE